MTQLAGTSDAPLQELCERFSEVCESAVDPLEIASALEFDGVSDRAARGDYGVDDVFALARLLYERVPRRPYGVPAPDQAPAARTLLHGLLYALPAVCFPAAAALLVGHHVLPALVVALLAGWGLSQGLASVGYRRLGTAGPGQARWMLRAGLAAGLVLMLAVMTLTWLLARARLPVIAFGAGEGAYMLGASVLLVTGTERWLPVALAPGVAGSALFLLLGRPPGLQALTWTALAATPLLACLFAWSPRTRVRPGRLLIPAELRGAAPATAFGVVAAGLLSFPVVAGPAGHGGVNVGALIASVPLALSMGAAEWNLSWYRRGAQGLLRLTGDPRWFRRRSRRLLLTAVAQYESATVVLICLAINVAVLSGQAHVGGAVLLSITGYLLLGAALFLVLLLQAIQVRAVPLAACAIVLAIEVALREHGLAVQVAAPAALLAVVGAYALACVGAAVRHA